MTIPLTKTKSEALRFDIDCSQKLAAGVTIASVDRISVKPVTVPALSAVNATVNTADKPLLNPSTGVAYSVVAGKCISIDVAGGDSFKNHTPQQYLVRVTFTASDSSVLEVVMPIVVNDYPS